MAKLLTSRDMAKISCRSCSGCGACCRDMGDSIHLDPYDLYLLTENLGRSFSDLLDTSIALHTEEGLVLPHLLMKEDGKGLPCCAFLDREGRCSVHSFRPGLCRLFPLGRDYDGTSFSYFIVEGGCVMPGKSKVRISSWLGYEDLASYETFTARWHYFVKDMQKILGESQDPEGSRQLALYILQKFYVQPWDPSGDFFAEFEERLSLIRRAFS